MYVMTERSTKYHLLFAGTSTVCGRNFNDGDIVRRETRLEKIEENFCKTCKKVVDTA